MPQLVFINRYYRPDHSATSQILTDLAEHLASRGFQVSVLCSRQLYNDPAAALPEQERIAGVAVYRIRTTRFGRGNLVGRAFDYASFHAFCLLWLLRNIRKDDTIVAKTDPPLISFIAALVAKARGARLVNWLQDLFPEVAFALGIKMPSVVRFLALRCRNYSLRIASINVAIGERMAAQLRAMPGISNVDKINNWAPGNYIKPIAHVDNPLRKEWQLEGKFVVGYSGNLGRAHEFSTILAAAAILKYKSPSIVFLIVGDGARKSAIENRVQMENLHNIIFKPYQPQHILSQSLSVADVHLVSQLASLEGLIVPSKFYGIIEAGRPTIFIGSPTGEIAVAVKQYGCGLTVEPGNADELVSGLEKLAGNPGLLKALADNALTAASGPLSRNTALIGWRRIVSGLAQS